MRNYPLYLIILLLIHNSCINNNLESTPGAENPEVVLLSDASAKDTFACMATAVMNPDTSYLEYLFSNYELENIRELDSTIVVKLQYADTGNFLKTNFYDGLRNAYFNCETAIRICNAQYFLQQIRPELSLIILDASRPLHIQQMMWDSLKMPADVKFNYLAPPYETSLHNYGCAVDVSIINKETMVMLDMGSPFDFFGKISQPAYETRLLGSGELSREAYENRLLLRNVMKHAKMNAIKSEWWHFSMCNKSEAAAKFALIK